MKLTYIDVWDRVNNLIPTLGRDFKLNIDVTGDASAKVELVYMTEIGKSFSETVAPLVEDQVRRLYVGAKPFGPMPEGLGKEVEVEVLVTDGTNLPEEEPEQAAEEAPPPQEEKKQVSVMELQWRQSMIVYSSSGTLTDYMRWVAQLVAAELNNRIADNKDTVAEMPEKAGKEWLDTLQPVTVKLPKTDMDMLFGPAAFGKFIDSAYVRLRSAMEKELMFGGTLRAEASLDAKPDLVADTGTKCDITLFYLGPKPETKGNQ